VPSKRAPEQFPVIEGARIRGRALMGDMSRGKEVSNGHCQSAAAIVTLYAHPEFAYAVVNLMCVRAAVTKNQATP
jgi:hypothetical protein